jgi:hypothetical protein
MFVRTSADFRREFRHTTRGFCAGNRFRGPDLGWTDRNRLSGRFLAQLWLGFRWGVVWPPPTATNNQDEADEGTGNWT